MYDQTVPAPTLKSKMENDSNIRMMARMAGAWVALGVLWLAMEAMTLLFRCFGWRYPKDEM